MFKRLVLSLQESHNSTLMTQAFHSGDEKGLAYFYKAFHPALSLYAFKYVNDHSIAEEIASEAFVKTWKMHWKLDSFGAIRAYLYKIVYRDSMTSLEHKQKREKSHRDSQPLTTDHYTPFDHLVRSEAYRIIHNSLKDLPPGQRRVMMMHYLEGKTSGQIASELNLHPSTIKTQKKQGLEALRKKLQEQGIVRFLVSKVKKGMLQYSNFYASVITFAAAAWSFYQQRTTRQIVTYLQKKVFKISHYLFHKMCNHNKMIHSVFIKIGSLSR